MKMEKNEAFTRWTSGNTFSLVMGRAQIAVLVSIHASIGKKERAGFGIFGSHPRLKHWLIGVRGLEERGLLIHTQSLIPKDRWSVGNYTIDECWKFTNAGLLVVELLKITGIYDTLLADFRSFEKLRSVA